MKTTSLLLPQRKPQRISQRIRRPKLQKLPETARRPKLQKLPEKMKKMLRRIPGKRQDPQMKIQKKTPVNDRLLGRSA